MLVDDWPEYVEAWLKHRPRGLVIMPTNDHNVGFSHPNVVRYDGTNLDEVRQRLQDRFDYPLYNIAEPGNKPAPDDVDCGKLLD